MAVKRALIIDVREQRPPEADPGALATLLHRRGGFEVVEMLDPSRSRLHSALIETFEDPELTPADELLVYYRGLGVAAPDGWCLAAADTDPADPDTALDAGVLAELADRSHARTAAVLLECRFVGPEPDQRIDLDRAVGKRGTVVLAATDHTDPEWALHPDAAEPSTAGSGFTADVAEALAGNVDETGTDGWITACDLAEHLGPHGRGYPAAGTGGAARTPVARVHDTPRPSDHDAAQVRPHLPEPDTGPDPVPDTDAWREVLAYWRDCRCAEAGLAARLDLLEPGTSVLWPGGHESVLAGAAGLVGLPKSASRFCSRDESAAYFYGYPLILVRGDHGRLLVPLLVAPLSFGPDETVEAETVTINPVLLDRLDTLEAAELNAAFAADFEAGDPDRLAAQLRDLTEALELDPVEPLDPSGLGAHLPPGGPTGVYNLAAIWRENRERPGLEALAATLPKRGETALAAVEHPEATETDDSPHLIDPFGLTAEQEAVVESAMRRPLTAVTLHPSDAAVDPTATAETVAAICATAQAAGETVLVAAGRSGALSNLLAAADRAAPGLVTLVPVDGADAEAERLERLLDVAAEPGGGDAAVADLGECSERIARLRNEIEEREDTEKALRGVQHRLDQLRDDPSRKARLRQAAEADDDRLRHVLDEVDHAERGRMVGAMARRQLRNEFDVTDHDGRMRLREEFETERALRDRQRALDEFDDAETLTERLRELRSRRGELGRRFAGVEAGRRCRRAASAVRERLESILVGEAEPAGPAKLLPGVPGWAVAADQVHRLGPKQGLFDLVIIDAAAACPLPEALALLLRAKRAVVLGEPGATRTHLHVAVDDDLRRAHGLPAEWTTSHGLRYVDGSAWDLCAPVADHLVLECTGNPAVEAVDTKGRVERAAPGSWINRVEAERLIERVVELTTTEPDATVAVACPFRAQAALIEAELESLGLADRVRVRRPGEPVAADTVVVSPVAAEGLPARDTQWVLGADGLWEDCAVGGSRLEIVCDREWWTERPGPLPRLLTTA